jgi:uncharacterized alpha-E superfamily protein
VCRSATGSLVQESANGRAAALGELLQRLGLASKTAETGLERENLQASLLALLYDERVSAGARPLLKRIHDASFSVRDRLSADTWRILNRLRMDAGDQPRHLPLVFASASVNQLVLDLAAFSGMEMENMTRGHGWAFLDFGRRIERATSIARQVGAVWRGAANRDLLLEPLLEMADSLITYRRRYFVEPRPAGVLELLLFEPTNPRGLAFQLEVLERLAATFPTGLNEQGVDEVQKQLAGLSEGINDLRGQGMDTPSSVGALSGLEELVERLGRISDLLTQVYFSQVLPRVS